MSQENVEIVRRAYDALNRGDWDAFFSDAYPDFEVRLARLPVGSGSNAGTLRGREQIQGTLEDYLATFDSMIFEPDQLIEDGDRVVAVVTRRARAKGSSNEMVVQNGHTWTLRDSRLLSMQSFPDPRKALEAAGLSE
jgi:ketosteroid isomerase-like protein